MLQRRKTLTATGVQQLSDIALMFALEEANDDLAAAASAKPESPWHQACFHAVVLLMNEHARRCTPVRH